MSDQQARIIKAGTGGVEPLPALRLGGLTGLPSGPAGAADQAGEILADARREAAALALQAEEKGYARGFERGQTEGRAAGERRAYEQTSERLEAAASSARRLFDKLARDVDVARAVLRRAAEVRMVRFAVDLAATAGGGGFIDERAIRRVIVEAVREADFPGRLTVVVSPENMDAVRECLPEATRAADGTDGVAIAADEALPAGTVRISATGGQVETDACLDLAAMDEREAGL
jgi:flagellar biosynthesis/type III secretory pathway protein FliH